MLSTEILVRKRTGSRPTDADMYHLFKDVEALNDHGYKLNLEMLQSVNEFLLTLENQGKPSAKLLETPSSVNDM